MGLLLSDVHLCLFRSPLLLNTLPHCSHVTLSLIGLCLPALLSLNTDWDCWLSGLLHVCTAMPPLLLNHFPHVSQFAAPSCSLTGLCLSSVHLCRALSHSLRNRLWHMVHTTFLTRSSLHCVCCCCLSMFRPWSLASFHFFLSSALSYQQLSLMPAVAISFFAWSLHLFLGPPCGRVSGNQLNRHILG